MDMSDGGSVSRFWRVMSSFTQLLNGTVSPKSVIENGWMHPLLEAAHIKYGVDGETVAGNYRLRNNIEKGKGYPIEFEG